MTDLTRILELDADQVNDLLMNHDLFPVEMVKLAARRKVELDKRKAVRDSWGWDSYSSCSSVSHPDYVAAQRQYNAYMARQMRAMPYSQPLTMPIESRFMDRLIGTGLW